MRLDVLLSGLENPQPAVRLDVVRVLGMLDETRALDRLRDRYQTETDPDVRNAISWAGKRLYQAQQAGYSTLTELFRHFGIDREIENMPDAAEAEMMKKMQQSFDHDLMQMKTGMMKRKAGWAAAAAIGGAAVGGGALSMIALSGAMQPGADAASSSLGGGRPQIGMKRAPATAPTNMPIDVWARRLREGPTEELREQAALELAQLNNPKALPALAAAFVGDLSPKVRQSAQKYGKVLYWNMIYWEIEQDGTLAQEMEKRAAEMGKNIKAETDARPGTGPIGDSSTPASGTSQPPKAAPPPEVDVTEILRRAQQGRAERKRKS